MRVPVVEAAQDHATPESVSTGTQAPTTAPEFVCRGTQIPIPTPAQMVQSEHVATTDELVVSTIERLEQIAQNLAIPIELRDDEWGDVSAASMEASNDGSTHPPLLLYD